jgi:hypothetical protein
VAHEYWGPAASTDSEIVGEIEVVAMKVKSIVQAGALCFKNSSLIKVFFLL